MNNTAKLLQECKIRPSFQRVEVLAYLQNVKTHPSVDVIYQALHEKHPNLSRTTVYNTVDLLSKKNIILTLDFGEGFLRYDGCVDPHSHFRCSCCGRVFDVEGAPADCSRMLPEGFRLDKVLLILHGVCADCAKR